MNNSQHVIKNQLDRYIELTPSGEVFESSFVPYIRSILMGDGCCQGSL